MTEEKKIKRRSFVKIFSGLIGSTLFSSYLISLLRSSIPIISTSTPERETVLTYKGRELKVEDLPEGEGLNATYLGYDYKGKEKEYLVVVVHLKPEDIKKSKFVVQNFVAYSTVCKHLGCTVQYRFDECKPCIQKAEFKHDGESQLIYCPCHFSQYDPYDGAKVVFGPAPEPLDPLEIRIKDGKIYGVRFLRYKEGIYA